MKPQLCVSLVISLLVSGCATVHREAATGQAPAPLPTLSFDKNGALTNKDALDDVCRDIAASPNTVLVFMHGWKGTAKPSDHNVISFQDMLAEVRRDSYTHGNRKLTGVYLTWPARSFPGPLEYPGYRFTQNRADQIAVHGGIADAIEKLSAAARRHRDGLIIVTGHSYGARILGRVVGHRPEVLRNLDLMLLANSADDAEACADTVRAVHRTPYRRGRLPKLVWVTSANDPITKTLYTVGNFKETPGHKQLYQSHIVRVHEDRAIVERGTGLHSRYAHNLLIAEGLAGHSDVWNKPMRGVVNYYLFNSR